MKQFALLRRGGVGGGSSISLPIRQHAQRCLLSSMASKGRDEPGSQSPGNPQQDGDLLKVDAETKTISTAVGSLPISPLMDPSYQEATQRFKKPKAKEDSRRKTKFQRQLARNPYAQALATPIRHCPTTRIAIPRFFLQDFKLFEHPETKEPWWVPAGLAPSHSPTATQAQDGEEAGQGSQATKPGGSTGYVLARQALLRSFSTKGSRYYGRYRQLQRSFRTAQMQGLASRAVWREDMDDLVLDLMRKRIVESLLFVGGMSAEQGRKYVQRLSGWEELKEHTHRGCVLVLDDAASGPGQFAMVDIEGVTRNGKLPVHNLVALLGSDNVDRLRQSAVFRQGSLFLLGRQRTVDLQLKLWKLQGYIESFPAQS